MLLFFLLPARASFYYFRHQLPFIEMSSFLRYPFDQLIVDLRHGGNQGSGKAALPGTAIAGDQIVFDKQIPLNIFHGDKEVLGTT